MLNAETGRMSGWAGCSGMSGRYRMNDAGLTFNTLMSMRTTCASKTSDLERRYLAALRSVSRAKVDEAATRAARCPREVARAVRGEAGRRLALPRRLDARPGCV